MTTNGPVEVIVFHTSPTTDRDCRSALWYFPLTFCGSKSEVSSQKYFSLCDLIYLSLFNLDSKSPFMRKMSEYSTKSTLKTYIIIVSGGINILIPYLEPPSTHEYVFLCVFLHLDVWAPLCRIMFVWLCFHVHLLMEKSVSVITSNLTLTQSAILEGSVRKSNTNTILKNTTLTINIYRVFYWHTGPTEQN